jgi:hypothetical protein
MAHTECEQVLGRVLAYVSGTGLAISREVAIVALKLVEDALSQDPGTDLYAYVMERLPLQFVLPSVGLPPLSPPIQRGSIGYGDL